LFYIFFYELQFFLFLSNFDAKLRKISVLQHKNGPKHTFFDEKLKKIIIFVCFMNTFHYICGRF